MMGFVDLTMICSSAVFADKRHVTPRLNLVNVEGSQQGAKVRNICE